MASVADCEPRSARSDLGDLPDLELPCLGGGSAVELRELTGRPTIMNLWASWCGPCREEMPMLQEAFEDHGDTVRFLGVDTRDTAAAALSFLSDSGVGYPQVADVDAALLEDLGVPGLPITLAVDSAGRIVTTQIGQMTPEILQDVLQQLSATAIPSPSS